MKKYRVSPQECSIEDCHRVRAAFGLCAAHRRRQKKGQSLDTPLRKYRLRPCEVKGCGIESHAKGLCSAHYRARYVDAADKMLQTKYGLSRSEKSELIESQGGVCAVCGNPDRTGRTLHIDHDHRCCGPRKSCGKCIRGAVCAMCNHRLSVVENEEWMTKAKRYLHRAVLTYEAGFYAPGERIGGDTPPTAHCVDLDNPGDWIESESCSTCSSN